MHLRIEHSRMGLHPKSKMKKISRHRITRLLMIAMGSLLLSARILTGCENSGDPGEELSVLTIMEINLCHVQRWL